MLSHGWVRSVYLHLYVAPSCRDLKCGTQRVGGLELNAMRVNPATGKYVREAFATWSADQVNARTSGGSCASLDEGALHGQNMMPCANGPAAAGNCEGRSRRRGRLLQKYMPPAGQ
jgi:hypothetical protein